MMDISDSESEGSMTAKEWECDFSTYVLYHQGSAGAPCLSFDILRDDLGDNRNCDVPVTCYIVTGSQADRAHMNNISVLKMSNLRKLDQKKKNNESDSESESEDEDETKQKKPRMASVSATHDGCVNRIKATNINGTPIAAAWSELGKVSFWDLSRMLTELDEKQSNERSDSTQMKQNHAPLMAMSNGDIEGFALDWSDPMPGTLATGDCKKFISVWKPEEGGTWKVSSEPYTAHTASVEDIQWSPDEPHVFASCSVDKSIRIWDERSAPSKACKISCLNAHESDVNVLHWNHNEPFIASGGDDGCVRVWDLRKIQTKTPVAELNYHNGPVCSVEWHADDSSVLATAGEDDSILQWDLAVEKDEEKPDKDDKMPQQLLFIHKGQKELKEIHWHPQVPGVMISTALSGFDVFKTISC